MEAWERTYQFVVRNEKIHVVPVSFHCMDCDYVTAVGRDILQHQLDLEHLYRMHPEAEMMEEWKQNKHPMVPLNMQIHHPQLTKELLRRNNV